tara:strand:- start:72 stop:1502 length:1431 start_codon:yes stop_codon:yes gene_type:complete
MGIAFRYIGACIVVLLLSSCATQAPEDLVQDNLYSDEYMPESLSEKNILQMPDEALMPTKEYAPKTQLLQEDLDTKPIKIALLVPLSGRYRELGRQLLDAAQLALFSFGNPNLVLLPIDTKGTSFGAVEAAKQSVAGGASLILGPVFSSSTKAVVPIAKKHNVELISFSNDISLSGTGAFVLGFRPEQQIERITEFALYQGVENFVSILPNNQYGATAAKHMRQQIDAIEGTAILKSEIYRVSRNGDILKLNKHVYGAYHAAMNSRPPKDYDEELEQYKDIPLVFPRAMLIAEGGKRLLDMAALLKKYGFDNQKIQLLGSAKWYDDMLLSEPILDGALFAAPPRERQIRFKNKFVSVYGYEPKNIASLAYDAIALAATLVKISGGSEFTKEALTNPRGFVGIDGIFRLTDSGLSERGLAIIGIHEGAFEVIEPSPKSFYELEERNSQKRQLLEQIQEQRKLEQLMIEANDSNVPAL